MTTLEATNTGVCLYKNCTAFGERDTYGLCPQHTAPPAQGSRNLAERSLCNQYPAARTHPHKHQAVPPVKVIDRYEYNAAVRMLEALTPGERRALLTRGILPTGPRWRYRHTAITLPTYMAGVAVAVAGGRYQVVDQ